MLLKNLASIFIPAILASALSFLLNTYSTLQTQHWIYSILYFTVVCFGFNLVYTARALKPAFAQLLLGSIVIKLLLALVVIVICSFLLKVDFFPFAIHFILHYVLFTIFEIRYLLPLIKNNTQHHES
jgi:voltage-gated potassium channel Kch